MYRSCQADHDKLAEWTRAAGHAIKSASRRNVGRSSDGSRSLPVA
jgi:hypothetical protein